MKALALLATSATVTRIERELDCVRSFATFLKKGSTKNFQSGKI